MNNDSQDKFFQKILKNSFEAKSSSGHLLDDEELLLQWSNQQLLPEEHEALLTHLANCSDCRKGIADMLKNGILEFREYHDPESLEKNQSLPSILSQNKKYNYFNKYLLGIVMTSSLCLFLCFFFLHGSPEHSEKVPTSGIAQIDLRAKPNDTDLSEKCDKFALLIGINKYGKLKENEHLQGCHNDIEDIKRVITNRFGFEEDNVTVLLDEKATASGIRKQLQELVKKVQARPQDTPPAQVLFYFSGHGSRVPDQPSGDPDHDAEDGFDSTLVVYDSEQQGSDSDIRDDELNKFSHNICRGGRAELLIALDSCHSGGGARGITKYRGLDRDFERILSTQVDMKNLKPKDIPEGTIFLSACQSNQKEPEYRRNEKVYGLFTYHFVKILESEQASNLNYESLIDLMRLSYLRDNISQAPTPTVEGSERSKKTLFGIGHSNARISYRETNRVEDSRDLVRMEAGATSGITKYSLFELYDSVENAMNPEAKSLGWFEIEKVDGVFSLGRFFRWSDEKQTQKDEVVLPNQFEKGFAVERYHDYGDNTISVRIIDVQTGKTLEPNDPTVPEPICSALTEFGNEESKWINWCGEDQDCDVVLKFDADAKMAALFPSIGCVADDQANSKMRDVSNVPEALRGGWGPIAWGPEEGKWTLRDSYLRKIIVALSLKRLVAEKDIAAKTAKEDNSKALIELNLFQPNNEGDFEKVEIDTRKGIVLECGHGKRYQLRVKNNDDAPFYVTILAIDPDMEISQLSHGPMSNSRRFNASTGTGNNPDANKLEADEEIVSNFRFAEPFGLQNLIVLATREPSNFSSFVQSGMGRTKGSAPPTNISRVFRFIDEQCSVGSRAAVDADVPRDDTWTVGTIDVIAELDDH